MTDAEHISKYKKTYYPDGSTTLLNLGSTVANNLKEKIEINS